MGCDIHLHIEVKINNTWHHYGAPHIKRWYELFSKMAGVRCENPEKEQIIPPRGLPSDITLITRLEWDTGGKEKYYHDASWFGGEEIAKLEEWLNEQGNCDLEWNILNTFLFSNSFAYQYHQNNAKLTLEYSITDVRFVFWFDN